MPVKPSVGLYGAIILLMDSQTVSLLKNAPVLYKIIVFEDGIKF